MGTGRTRRRTTALALAIGVLVAACSPGPGVTTNSAARIDDPTTTSVTSVSTGAGSDDTAPPTAAPTVVPADPVTLPSLSDPDPDTLAGELDNGLRYLVRNNDNPGGKAELRLAVDAGSVLEDESQAGGAHFLEHMLFNGTERFPKNELVDVLRSFGAGFGADVNASTSYDETVYTLTVPNQDDVVETGLDILDDWLSAATIAPDDVEAERGVVLDEWRTRSQTSGGRILEQFAEFQLAGTPYAGRSPIGGREAIETIRAEDLRRFYDDWYRPDNASIVVVGEIDPVQVEQWIIDRFTDATSRTPNPPARDEVAVGLSPSTRVDVVADPELAEGFVAVALPLPLERTGSIAADAQNSILDDLAFDIVATRLDNDALRGTAPYERAAVDSASFVRAVDAPEITVDVGGEGADASVEAIVDEFERIARFGVSAAEVDRAVASRRSAAQRSLDGSGSRQDSSFADEYVRHVLEGEWYVTAAQEFAFVSAVLDAASAESIASRLDDRYSRSGIAAFVGVPVTEVALVGSTDELTSLIDGAGNRDLEPRDDEAQIGDSLLRPPPPVAETGRAQLSTDPFTDALDPVVLTFPNGVRVALNTTTIVERQVLFQARSPGGLRAVADADVADADALGTVLAESGAGDFDRIALETFLDDKSVEFSTSIDSATDSMQGVAATGDLEVLFQLVHLAMTAPHADRSAVDRYVDDSLPFALDPSIDAGYAEYDALLDARYDDPRFLLPTPESLATVDVEGIERVARERFANAGDWSFAFSGDFDVDAVVELARTYLGTLPATGVADSLDFSDPPPPRGPVVVDATAGEGETANVSFLFTSEATADRSDDVLSRVVQEVIGNRLTDFIREELGDSYSPTASIDLGGGARPSAETYISVSTAPDLADEVSVAVIEQLNDLRADGPTDREFSNAVTTVGEQLNFIDNAQIDDEILDVLVDPQGSASFDDFVNQAALVGGVTPADVNAALARWVPTDEYIEVRVLPAA